MFRTVSLAAMGCAYPNSGYSPGSEAPLDVVRDAARIIQEAPVSDTIKVIGFVIVGSLMLAILAYMLYATIRNKAWTGSDPANKNLLTRKDNDMKLQISAVSNETSQLKVGDLSGVEAAVALLRSENDITVTKNGKRLDIKVSKDVPLDIKGGVEIAKVGD